MRRILVVGALLGCGGCLSLAASEEAPEAVPCTTDADCSSGELCGTSGRCGAPDCEPGEERRFWPDGDGDGLGDPTRETLACVAPQADGWVEVPGDCDDGRAEIQAEAQLCARSCAGSSKLADCTATDDAQLKVALDEVGNRNFGQSSALGDLDGDGAVDLVLSSFFDPADGACVLATEDRNSDGTYGVGTCGRVTILWGPLDAAAGANGGARTELHGPDKFTQIGRELASLGDLDGDGADELGVAFARAPSSAQSEIAEVVAQVWYGRPRAEWERLALELAGDWAVPPTATTSLRSSRPVSFGAAPPGELVVCAGFQLFWLSRGAERATSIVLDGTTSEGAMIELELSAPPHELRGDARFDIDGDGERDLVVAARSAEAGHVGIVRGPLTALSVQVSLTAEMLLETESDVAFAKAIALRRAPTGPELWVGDYGTPPQISAADGAGNPSPRARGGVRIFRWDVERSSFAPDGTVTAGDEDLWFGYQLHTVASPSNPASDGVVVTSGYGNEDGRLAFGAMHVFAAERLDARGPSENLTEADRLLRVRGTTQVGLVATSLDCAPTASSTCGGLDLVLAPYESAQNAVYVLLGVLEDW